MPCSLDADRNISYAGKSDRLLSERGKEASKKVKEINIPTTLPKAEGK